MSSRIIVYLTIAVGLFVAFEFGSVVGNGNYFGAGLILIGLILVGMFSVIGRDATLEARVLTGILAGYFIAGKGFAYITPAPPVYIGELALGCLMIAYIIRVALSQVDKYGPPLLTGILVAICTYAFIRLALTDFERFGMLALRDSATEYYALFFFIAYFAFKDESSRQFILGKLKWAALAGIVILIVMEAGLNLIDLTAGFTLFGVHIFEPHDDIRVAVFCGTVVWISTGDGKLKSQTIPRLLAGVLLTVIVIPGNKVAFASSLTGVFVFLVLGGCRRLVFRFIMLGILAAVLFALALNSVDLFGNSTVAAAIDDNVETRLEGMKPDNILSERGRSGAMETGSTKEWRVDWWRKIKSDVDATDPLFGLGLGSDITTPFMQEYYGNAISTDEDQTLARYPHNIIFTVLGRLGYLGLTLWVIFFLIFLRSVWNAARQIRVGRAMPHSLAVWSFVIGGFCDSFVQSTFENPYAGIPFWVMFALALRMYEAGEAGDADRDISAPPAEEFAGSERGGSPA